MDKWNVGRISTKTDTNHPEYIRSKLLNFLFTHRQMNGFLEKLYFFTVKWRSTLFASLKPPILIVSRGRSGSTLLCDVLNKNREFLTLFEPFNKEYNPESAQISIFSFLDPSSTNAELAYLFNQYLRAGFLNRWKYKVNKHIVHGTRILIKDIRINFMVPWIIRHFPQMKIVVLIRNPINTITSHLKSGFPHAEVFLRYEK
jgi:hypothetical protein